MAIEGVTDNEYHKLSFGPAADRPASGTTTGEQWQATDSPYARTQWTGTQWVAAVEGSVTAAVSTSPRSAAVITLNNRSTTGSTAALDVSGYGTAILNVSANAGSTVQFEGSVDGSTYIAIKGHQRGAGIFSSTTASTGVWVFDVRGFSNFRANITVAAGAATATAYGTASPGVSSLIDVEGNIGSGSTDAGNPVKIGGVYNTTLPTLTNGQRGDAQVDANGRLITAPTGFTTGKITITRPANATPYTAGDVLGATAAAITLPTIGPAGGGEVLITSAALEIDVAAVPTGMSSFTLYLYNVTPPSALADNAAWDLPAGDRTAFIGQFSLGTPVDLGSTLRVQIDSLNLQVTVPSGGSLWAYLSPSVGFTPAGNSEVYVLTVHAVAV